MIVTHLPGNVPSWPRGAGILCLGMGLLVSGCALQPSVPGESVSWDQRREELSQLPEWQARGRIAVKSEDGGGQGNLQWRQSGPNARIRLSGPFGVGGYEIAWGADSLIVTGKSGQLELTYAGPDAAEQFLRDQLGWSFPAVSLRYWILAIPHPDFDSRTTFSDDGWLAGIEQNGWVIGYDRFEKQNTQWLPGKIVMENPATRVKMVVDTWVIPQ